MVKRPPPDRPVFEIWQAGDQIVSVDNPVRLRILVELETGPCTLGQLAKATGKGKPTLSSLHLPWLQRAGLVTESPDPADARLKWFGVAGVRLGRSAVDAPALRDAVLDFVESKGFVPLAPMLHVLDPEALVRSASDTYRHAVADRLGVLVGRMLLTTEAARRPVELDAMLRRSGLLPARAQSEGLRRFVARVRSAALTPRSSGKRATLRKG